LDHRDSREVIRLPFYEYVCKKCGEVFSRLQKMTAAQGETACPKCGGNEAERLISACSIGGGTGGHGGGG
jgi:putative FmdB family regulatory protein